MTVERSRSLNPKTVGYTGWLSFRCNILGYISNFDLFELASQDLDAR